MSPAEGARRSQHAEDNHFAPRQGFESFPDAAAGQSIVDRLMEVAGRRGSDTALVDGNVRLSYSELIDRAATLGGALAHHLAGRPGVVALHVTAGRMAVEGMLGALVAGRPCLCLPASTPRVALHDILRGASPAAILTDDSATALETPDLPQFRVGDLRRFRAQDVRASAAADDLACLFVTSGTTGSPKLVGLSHRAVVFDVRRQTNDLFLGPDDRMDLLFHPSFSASLSSVFSALLTGAELHLGPPPGIVTSLGQWLIDSEITVSTMTVSTLRTLCGGVSRASAPPRLRLLSVGGEALLSTDVLAFNAAFPASCVLQNAMASTETRTYAQYFVPRDGPPESPVPIGWPVDGKEVIVVDSAGAPLPAGEEGEILVRSHFLANGYVNDPELTSARFIPQPDGTVVFRTGDRGRFRDDGCLVFAGRSDSLVKIRGYRVEPGAVEHALLADCRIREAAVVRRASGSGDDFLAAFVVVDGGARVTDREIQQPLLGRLPAYAVPTAIHVVAALPLNRNGKVDYRSLAEGEGDDRPCVHASPDGRLTGLCESWALALGRATAGSEDHFFENGGDSLSAIRLQLEVHQRLGVDLSLETLVRCPTPRAVAAWLDRCTEPVPAHPALVLLHPGGTGLPLFCVPGIGGEPHGFSHLAEHLGHDRPVYGFRATVSGEPPGQPLRVEAIAGDYLDAVDTVMDAAAPVHICGHSFGGIVALEMAHQLNARGRHLGLFAIIDTPLGAGRPGLVGRVLDTAANLPAWLWYDALRSGRGALFARALGKSADAWRRVRQSSASTPHHGYPDLRAYFGQRHIPPELAARVYGRIDAARRYVRRPVSGPVVLLRSRAQALMGRSDRCLGWDALAASVDVFDVPGHHSSCTAPPHVKHVAAVLATRLRASDPV